MADEQKPNPANEGDTDISKAQAAQQPQKQAQSEDQPDEGLQGDTLATQRADIEGISELEETDEAEGGFVGSQSDADSSSELVEDEDEDFAKGDGE